MQIQTKCEKDSICWKKNKIWISVKDASLETFTIRITIEGDEETDDSGGHGIL